MNTISISKQITIGLILVSLFAGMTAFAETNTETTTKKPEKNKTERVVNLTCMQTAVDTRETAIMKNQDDFAAAIKTAMTARKTALHDAWGLSDKSARKEAIRKAWKTWKDAVKKAKADREKANKATWETFRTTAKTSCKEELPKEEAVKTETPA